MNMLDEGDISATIEPFVDVTKRGVIDQYISPNPLDKWWMSTDLRGTF